MDRGDTGEVEVIGLGDDRGGKEDLTILSFLNWVTERQEAAMV